jgi:2'-5' RNA ligase
MTTRFASYVVAEIPKPVRSKVQALRESFGTPTALLPVEITLLGSSGVGPIPAGTSIRAIQEQIDFLFGRIAPWDVTFAGIRVFPETAIAYLAPVDRSCFDRVHAMLRDSTLPHTESPFSYNPHCTLRSGPATPGELSRILEHPFPGEPFRIDTISVYEFDDSTDHCELIYRRILTAEKNATF